jgi:hypothetical protein
MQAILSDLRYLGATAAAQTAVGIGTPGYVIVTKTMINLTALDRCPGGVGRL